MIYLYVGILLIVFFSSSKSVNCAKPETDIHHHHDIAHHDIIHQSWLALMDSDFFKEERENYNNNLKNPNTNPSTNEHHCIHDHPKISTARKSKYEYIEKKLKEQFSSINSDTKKREILQTWQPIRIFSDNQWINPDDVKSCKTEGQVVILEPSSDPGDQSGVSYTCKKDDILSDYKVKLLTESILPATLNYISSVLSVKPVVGNLILDSVYADKYGKECREDSGVSIPDYMFTEGKPDTDYMLLVSSRPIASELTLAYASPCSHQILNSGLLSRPLAGSINFNPGTEQLNDPNLLLNPFEFAKLIRIALHELTHALGFSADLYQYYVDDKGKPYDNLILDVDFNGEVVTNKITSPKVLAFVREFFDCPTLDGMELENNDPIMPGSHWEKRIAGNEYMSPISGPQMMVSKLTLSLFEDMGWYKANYSMADGNRWGYHKGCNFVNEPCGIDNWGRYFCNYFQDQNPMVKCNGDQTAIGYCDLKDWRQPMGFRYEYFFDHPTWGGSQQFADYCPTILGFGNTYCQDVISGALFLGSPDPSTRYGSRFSPNSACFEFSWEGSNVGDAACYVITCTDAGGLEITVYNTVYQCPTEGGVITVQIPLGPSVLRPATINCPPADFFCGQNTTIMKLGEPPASLVKYTNQSNNLGFHFVWILLIISSLYLLVINL